MNKKKKNLILKIIGGSTILTTVCVMTVLICVLMIFNFFGSKLTKEMVVDNKDYAEEYRNVVNKYLKDGYVPLQRILYFYLEDTSLSIDTLYTINQNKETKTTKEIEDVCTDVRVKDMVACSPSNIKDNEDYLVVSSSRFNLPLDYNLNVTSFFNEQRVVFDEENTHLGWDLSAPAQTPVYSVCEGTVEKVTFTQSENVTYDESKNDIGNIITIKCDKDYFDTYYVVYAHLYPNSAKVNVGDKVNHFTEIASVGTTGHSTGNHLHYEVQNEKREAIDGMHLIDFTLEK